MLWDPKIRLLLDRRRVTNLVTRVGLCEKQMFCAPSFFGYNLVLSLQLEWGLILIKKLD